METLLRQELPNCKWCEEPTPAARWRYSTNDSWGQRIDDETGNVSLVTEEEAYERWNEEGPPDGVYGICEAHFHYKRDHEGNIVLSPAGRHWARVKEKARQEETSRSQRARAQRDGLRETIVSLLGRECGECDETNLSLLRIQWLPGRRDFDGTQLEWYRWLLADPDRLDRCTVRCLGHLFVKPNEVRDAVIEEYGDVCGVCAGTERLWIVPAAGTQAPRYPGGRKMGSKDKVRWLVAQGFPPGWLVRCVEHVTQIEASSI